MTSIARYAHARIIRAISTLLIFSSIQTLGYTQILLNQGFNSGTFPPTGWTNVKVAGISSPGTWNRVTSGSSPSQSPHAGSGEARYNSFNYFSGTCADLSTPVLNFTASASYTVDFWMYRDNSNPGVPDKVEVYVSLYQSSLGATLIGTIYRHISSAPVVATAGWYQYSFTIPAAYNTATNYITFKAISGFGSNMFIDDVSVNQIAPAAPSCIPSFSPATGATGLCTNTTLIWGNTITAQGYKLTMGTNAPNYDNLYNNLDLGNTLSYDAVLNPSTTYGWKITPYNAFGIATGCIFNTLTTGASLCYCIPVYTEASCTSNDYINNFSTTGGATNITNNGSGCSANPNNYTFFSTKTVTQKQGSPYNVSMQSGALFAEGYGIWADWNQDGDFTDAGEFVFSSPSATTAVVNGVITIPYTASIGTTRFRVRCAYGYVPTASECCTTYDDGETEDYNVAVTACVTSTFYADADGDTYGNASYPIAACTLPIGYVVNNTDCNDSAYAAHPGAIEICDGIDDDCDANIDEGLTFTTYFQDADGDGYGTNAVSVIACVIPSGYVTNHQDCNDLNAAVHISATEICDGIDDDCDGSIDEGLTFTTYYQDTDGDGFGKTSPTTSSCSGITPAGYSASNTDCNDINASINPSAIEVCNGIDDNCSGGVDDGLAFTTYYQDTDGDGFGKTLPTTSSCSITPPTGYAVTNTDCNDGIFYIHPGSIELCNSIDDNCNGSIDEGIAFFNYYADADADGYGNAAIYVNTCAGAPVGYVTNNTDCNDGSATSHPGAIEICDGLDNDCNGVIDNGLTFITYYIDADHDTYGNALINTSTCSGIPVGYATNSLDCNDADDHFNPAAYDECGDGLDQNCNGIIDDGNIIGTISPAGSVSICAGTTQVLTAGIGYDSYKWYKNGALIAGASSYTYTVTATGNYYVTIYSGACTVSTPQTTVTLVSAPKAKITPAGSLDICATGSVLLKGGPTGVGFTYQWRKSGITIAGATDKNYVATSIGSYTVKVTNATGCTKTSAAKVVTTSCKASSEPQLSNQLQLYPNPAFNNFTVSMVLTEQANGIAIIDMYNMLGEKVFSTQTDIVDGAINEAITLSNITFSAGVYLVKVYGDHFEYSTSLIIER